METLSLLLDTNVLRYRAHKDNQYKVTPLWNLIRLYPNNIDLFISQTTVEELEVQRYLLKEAELRKLDKLLDIVDILKCNATDNDVHETRRVSSYIAGKYALRRSDDPKKRMDVPSTNDAKILLTAYEHKCHIVTRNIKDFILYPCLQDGYSLWNCESNSSHLILPLKREELRKDPNIKKYINRITSPNIVESIEERFYIEKN